MISTGAIIVEIDKNSVTECRPVIAELYYPIIMTLMTHLSNSSPFVKCPAEQYMIYSLTWTNTSHINRVTLVYRVQKNQYSFLRLSVSTRITKRKTLLNNRWHVYHIIYNNNEIINNDRRFPHRHKSGRDINIAQNASLAVPIAITWPNQNVTLALFTEDVRKIIRPDSKIHLGYNNSQMKDITLRQWRSLRGAGSSRGPPMG